MAIKAPETEETTQTKVICDGGGGEHPRVWLQIPAGTGWVECPYCDKRFILKSN